ncbi:hypothetical protein LZ30DRAFT_403712 [Colletotrichum cereale]|nr:hypothetical protein LZ30DRAFT_403712 [Colletotrichum cereale]
MSLWLRARLMVQQVPGRRTLFSPRAFNLPFQVCTTLSHPEDSRPGTGAPFQRRSRLADRRGFSKLSIVDLPPPPLRTVERDAGCSLGSHSWWIAPRGIPCTHPQTGTFVLSTRTASCLDRAGLLSIGPAREREIHAGPWTVNTTSYMAAGRKDPNGKVVREVRPDDARRSDPSSSSVHFSCTLLHLPEKLLGNTI